MAGSGVKRKQVAEAEAETRQEKENENAEEKKTRRMIPESKRSKKLEMGKNEVYCSLVRSI